MITEIRLKKGQGEPSSLKFAEPAVDMQNKVLYIGMAEGGEGGSKFLKIIDEEKVRDTIFELILDNSLIKKGTGNHSFITNDVENNEAKGDYSFAGGSYTSASGDKSHTEGYQTEAKGMCSHAEGYNTLAKGNYTHVEGQDASASGEGAHSEGGYTEASGDYSHAEGYGSIAFGDNSHVEGEQNYSGYNGCYFYDINFIDKKITLTKDPKNPPSTTTKIHSYSKGQYVSIVSNGVCYDNILITGVDNNVITVSRLPFNSIMEIDVNDKNDHSVFDFNSLGNGGVNFGNNSHAEGTNTKALGVSSHSEGDSTVAISNNSHAEGIRTMANGIASHAEGTDTISSNVSSHAEGCVTVASGNYSHAEGFHSTASGNSSHAEGYDTTAAGEAAHTEGESTFATGDRSHAEGHYTVANGDFSHVQGKYNIEDNENKYAHIVGNGDMDGRSNAHTLDWQGNAWFAGTIRIGGGGNFDTGYNIATEDFVQEKIDEIDSGNRDFDTSGIGAPGVGENAEVFNGGDSENAFGDYSHAEGGDTQSKGFYSHAEGYGSIAEGFTSHAEGNITEAIGDSSHSEGDTTQAKGFASHAEGYITEAIGDYSHSEGDTTQAKGFASHAEGYITEAIGDYSHSEGQQTVAKGENQHVQGRFNIVDDKNKYAHIVGNGRDALSATEPAVYSNAHTLDWDGNAWYAGEVFVGKDNDKLTTKKYVDEKISKIVIDGGGVVVDDKFSITSENPVQNKLITAELNNINKNLNIINDKIETINIDEIDIKEMYGGLDVVPSDEKLFTFITDDETMTAKAILIDDIISPEEIDNVSGDIVVPYMYNKDDKTYTVNNFETNYIDVPEYIQSITIPNTVIDFRSQLQGQALYHNIYHDGIENVYIDSSEAIIKTNEVFILPNTIKTISNIELLWEDAKIIVFNSDIVFSSIYSFSNSNIEQIFANKEVKNINYDFSWRQNPIDIFISKNVDSISINLDPWTCDINVYYEGTEEDWNNIKTNSLNRINEETGKLKDNITIYYENYREYLDEGSIKNGSGLNSIVLEPDNGNKAYGDYSISGGYNSKVIGNYGVALGINTTSGMKAFYIKSIDIESKKIYLSKTKVVPVVSTDDNTDANFKTPKYEIGDSFNIIAKITEFQRMHYQFVGKITDIVNNVITYDVDLPFTELYDDVADFSPTFSVGNRPEVGSVIISNESFAEGGNTFASGENSHAEGYGSIAAGNYSHAEGRSTKAAYGAHSEGYVTVAKGLHSHAEGMYSESVGTNSHAEGRQSQAIGTQSHAEGYLTIASANNSHAEGHLSTANSSVAHAEGYDCDANGQASHVEGYLSTSDGVASHAEGYNVIAKGNHAHAEGSQTHAYGDYSHSEGRSNKKVNSEIFDESGNILSNDKIIEKHSSLKFSLAKGLASHVEGLNGLALGDYSHSEGNDNISKGSNSHSEGFGNSAIGNNSHAEGKQTEAIGENSHSEGYLTDAIGSSSHAEGHQTIAEGNYSHVEGVLSRALNNSSHAEGYDTLAQGIGSHSEGVYSQAIGDYSHAEGKQTEAIGENSHSEGYLTDAIGSSSHAEGHKSMSFQNNSHAEGNISFTGARGYYCSNIKWIENNNAIITLSTMSNKVVEEFDTDWSIVNPDKLNVLTMIIENSSTITIYNKSIKILNIDKNNITVDKLSFSTIPNGTIKVIHPYFGTGVSLFSANLSAHAEGDGTFAIGTASHTEGCNTIAYGIYSHVEGNGTIAMAQSSHAEGQTCQAKGIYGSHAEGYSSQAVGQASHAEGRACNALGDFTHAEGHYTTSNAIGSHTEGDHCNNINAAKYSHAEGIYTIACCEGQHVQGKYNVRDDAGKYAHIVGNGTSNSNVDRRNIHTLDWNGNAWFEGDVVANDISMISMMSMIDSLHYYCNKDIVSNVMLTIYDEINQNESSIMKTKIMPINNKEMPSTLVLPIGCDDDVYKDGILSVSGMDKVTKIIIPRGCLFYNNDVLKEAFSNLKTIVRIDEDGFVDKYNIED